jgi:hypothetical protein
MHAQTEVNVRVVPIKVDALVEYKQILSQMLPNQDNTMPLLEETIQYLLSIEAAEKRFRDENIYLKGSEEYCPLSTGIYIEPNIYRYFRSYLE